MRGESLCLASFRMCEVIKDLRVVPFEKESSVLSCGQSRPWKTCEFRVGDCRRARSADVS
jgi:hypothetical protein